MFKRFHRNRAKFFFLLIPLAIVAKIVFSVIPLLSERPVEFSPPVVLAGDQKAQPPADALAKAGNVPATPAIPQVGAVRDVSAQKPAETFAFIQQKEAELKRKEEDLRAKEETLSRMEKEVEQKLKELMAIQKEIQAYRTEREENQNGKVRSLAKIYGTMKPKEAAKLLDNLDEKLVMNIIATMNSDEAAGILSNMDVKKAAKISEALTAR